MGGRITRAIYKNERASNKLNTSQSNNEIRKIASVFSLVVSGILSFLTGYLLRPHLLTNIYDKKSNTDTEIEQTVCVILSVLVVLIVQLGYVMKVYHKKDNDSCLQIVKRSNKVLIITSISCLIIHVLGWLAESGFDLIFRITYALLWVNITQNCLSIINTQIHNNNPKPKIQQNIRKSAQMQINQQKHNVLDTLKKQKDNQDNNKKRAIFLFTMFILLNLGAFCSDKMKDIRVQKTAKLTLQKLAKKNSQLDPSVVPPQSDLASFLERLPVSYRAQVLESEDDEKIMLRVMFSLLIFMIVMTVIAFQKKSLLHLFHYDKNKHQFYHIFETKIIPQNVNKNGNLENQIKENTNKVKLKVKGCDKISSNFRMSRIVINSVLYILAWLVIQNWHSQIISKSQTQFSLNLGFYSYCALVVAVLLIASFILKITAFSFHKQGSQNLQQKSSNLENKKKKTANLIGLTLGLVFMMILKMTVNFLLQDWSQFKFIDQILEPLVLVQVMRVLLIFYFLRLTKDEVLRFPQLSHQYYNALSITVGFVLKYLVTGNVKQYIGKQIISCTTLPVIKLLGISSQLNIIRTNEQQQMASSLVFIYLVILVIIWISDYKSYFDFVESKIPVKKQYKNQALIHFNRNLGNTISQTIDQTHQLINHQF